MNTGTKKVAFIGLGVMGFPMAGHLASMGYDVTVYNRTSARADQWLREHKGRAGRTPRESATDRDIVFTCVGNDDDVRSVVYGDNGILSGMKEGAILVDHTTDSANLARELEAAAIKENMRFLDAPVSGGQAGAENGALTIMVGGADQTFSEAESVMKAYAKAITLMGPAGNGQLTKMVNQICIAGLVQGLAEGIHFGMKVGLDIPSVVDTISKGAAGSWQMENRGVTMAKDEFEFGFAVNWMRKDLKIALEEAEKSGARLPTTALIDQFYSQVQKRGGGRWDTSSLIQLLTHD